MMKLLKWNTRTIPAAFIAGHTHAESMADDFEKAFQLVFEAYSCAGDLFENDEDYIKYLRKRVTKAFTLMQRIRAHPPIDAQAALDRMIETIPRRSGVRDANGEEIWLGDHVVYKNEGPHTKPEYWNPEYEVVFEAPCFTLRHIGGGKPGDSRKFQFRCGGANGALFITKKADWTSQIDSQNAAIHARVEDL